jgi:hypothetical protein
LSAFFSGKGEFLIDILPEGMKMDTGYFAENIIDKMARFCFLNGR